MRICVLAVLLGGCSFITDFSPPGDGGAGAGGMSGAGGNGGNGGNGGTGGSGGMGCGNGQKMCGSQCVSTTDPAFGCAQSGCAACAGAANATPACSDGGACTFRCNFGFGNCDNDPRNGCEQNLLDDHNNCGGCSVRCESGQCTGGACQIVPPQVLGDLAQLTGDGSSLYFTTGLTSGEVIAASPAGNGQTVLATAEATPSGIAVDSTFVYFACTGDGTVRRIDKQGLTEITLASGQSSPFGVATDGTSLFWTNAGNGTVMKLALGTGVISPPVRIAQNQQSPTYLALSSTQVYFSDTTAGTVMRVNKNGTAGAQPVATGQSVPRGIAIDAAGVTWTNAGSGQIMRLPNGASQPVPIATGQQSPSGIAGDGNNVWWSNTRIQGAILRLSFAPGATPVPRAINQNRPFSLLVDNTFLYWLDLGDGSIQRAPR